MKKITRKLWIYGIGFLLRSIIFNISLGFSIASLVFVKEGFTIWAIIAISVASFWVIVNIANHLVWGSMSKNERALYFGIRRHGKEVVEVTEKEIKRRTGQQDILEILRDTDSSLEIQMLINGSGTFVNTFVGIKWIHWARLFNKNQDIFEFKIVKEE